MLITTGTVNLVTYILFIDENPDYDHIITLEFAIGAAITGLGIVYVLRDRRKEESSLKDY
jgi:hypothetical protein